MVMKLQMVMVMRMVLHLKNSQGVMRVSLAPLGAFSMMSRSGGLKERAVAGRPSVTRLTHSSWTGMRASGRPRAAARKMQTTSPMLEEIRYLGRRGRGEEMGRREDKRRRGVD